jgi:hypothetical protein
MPRGLMPPECIVGAPAEDRQPPLSRTPRYSGVARVFGVSAAEDTTFRRWSTPGSISHRPSQIAGRPRNDWPPRRPQNRPQPSSPIADHADTS